MNDDGRQEENTIAYDLVRPTTLSCPLVVDSPHSWKDYPPGFNPACKREDLLTSWDAWVDELFSAAPSVGAPLLSARFPRFFIDLNRARDDIDPDMVNGDMPFPLRPTEKTQKGFGLLRRFALPEVLVYDAPLSAERLLQDIETYYDPYHAILGQLIDEKQEAFGRCVHLDCHSMKSCGNAMNEDNGALRPDIVVSDSFGTTADPAITAQIAAAFSNAGLHTQINDPYKGAEMIKRHSIPQRGRHSIQIEINRSLYMNESAFTRSSNFTQMKQTIDSVLNQLAMEL